MTVLEFHGGACEIQQIFTGYFFMLDEYDISVVTVLEFHSGAGEIQQIFTGYFLCYMSMTLVLLQFWNFIVE